MPDNVISQNHQSKLRKGISLMPGILIICLVALVIFIAIWYYFNYIFKPQVDGYLNNAQNSNTKQNQTTNTTANWKTYTNTNQHYSIKYPKDYYLVDDCYDSIKKGRTAYDNPKWLVFIDKTKIADNFPGCNSDYPSPYLAISAVKEKINLDQEKNNNATDLESKVALADQEWLKLISTSPSELDNSYGTTLLVNYENKGYSIFWKNSDAKGSHDSMIDRIVTTFKFTK